MKSWTPMQANMNCRRVVTRTMFPMVRMATNTHCTTCCKDGGPGRHLPLLAAQPSPAQPSGLECKPHCLPACRGQKGLTGQSCPGASPSLLRKGGGPSRCCLGQVWSQAWRPLPPRVPLRPSHLQAFGSVDGPERSEHPQDPQDLHHRDGTGPGGGLLSLPLPPALCTPAYPPGPPPEAACVPPWDRGASCPGLPSSGAAHRPAPPSDRSSPGTRAVFPTGLGATALSPHALLVSHTHSACRTLSLRPLGASPRDPERHPQAARGPPTRTGGCPTHSSPMEMRDTATTTRSRMLK